MDEDIYNKIKAIYDNVLKKKRINPNYLYDDFKEYEIISEELVKLSFIDSDTLDAMINLKHDIDLLKRIGDKSSIVTKENLRMSK